MTDPRSEAAPPNNADTAGTFVMAVRQLSWPPRDPLALLPAVGPAFAWADPATGFVLVAAGAAVSVEGAGPADLAMRIGEAAPAEATGEGPPVRWVGGFSFDGRAGPRWTGFPAAWLFLPETLLTIEGNDAWLSVVGRDATGLDQALDRAEERVSAARPHASPLPAMVSSEDGPPLSLLVTEVLEALGAGVMQKVVVCTSRRLTLAAEADPAQVLMTAASGEPTAKQFLVRAHGAAVWLGASPERLVRVVGSEVSALALAGTAARGRDPEHDVQCAKALMASAKDRAEHDVVVTALREAFADGDASAAWVPRVRRLARVFHLETEVTASRPENTGILDLAQRIHPTPALAGWPRVEALEFLAVKEPEGRGWYGGAVGWVTPEGEGDLAVGIRGMLLNGPQVTGFAGAGVVAGSEPDAEAREAELKLNGVLAAFSRPGVESAP